MSEAEKIELNKVLELKSELEAVAYGDLKKEFAKRGIENVFKPGTKKEVLIAMAVEALTNSVVPDAPLKEADEIEVEFTEVGSEEQFNEPHGVADGAEEKEFEQKDELVIEGEPLYSREVIEENLNILAATLKVCTEYSKKAVFDKQEFLLAHLAYLDKWEKENK